MSTNLIIPRADAASAAQPALLSCMSLNIVMLVSVLANVSVHRSPTSSVWLFTDYIGPFIRPAEYSE